MAINTDKYFFWAKETKKVIAPFFWLLGTVFVFYFPFSRPWWWVVVPVLLVEELRVLYLWWIAWDYDYANKKWVVLEIVPPREVLVPIKAMEDVLSVMFNTLCDVANFRERWCDGMLDNTPNWMSWEIVSIEGAIHFYARVTSYHRSGLEAILYSHYPDLEIQEVPDYARNIPQTIPNKEWDLYGEEYITKNPPAYSIKTYEKFFEPQGEKISAEEKRIDPINSLLESMAKLGPGEQYWAQFIITSALDHDEPGWRKEAADIIAKLTRRPVKKKVGLFDEVMTVSRDIVLGPQQVGSGEKATYKWAETAAISDSGEREMLLTPGERETLLEIENKIRKPVFRTTIRGIYVAQRENWQSTHRILLRSYMGHFRSGTSGFDFNTFTRTRVHYLFRKRRVFLRARRMIRNAVSRFPPYFPERRKGNVLLSTEEFATLFHFPIKITSLALPTVEKVEHRKGGPPANLPIG